ncbi:MAG TPA: hypothetical protein VJ598_00745 [Albitalea sp.]|nr:hypothetical protein [Albitalea sp.]
MSFDQTLESAWNDHVDHLQQVAESLPQSLPLVAAPENVAPFVHLLTHVFGEHLGQWSRAIELLQEVRELPACRGSEAVAALERGIATMRYAGGDGEALASLAIDERIAALASAASALAGRNEFKRALAAYSEALQHASAGLAAGSPAIRALAVGGNNLAVALEEKLERDAAETQGMIAAAEAGLRYWKLAGTWLQEERAEHRLARCLLRAGQAAAALRSAQRCVAICAQNDAPAFEQFFAHAVLALAQRAAGDAPAFAVSRARAQAFFEQVPTAEQRWCESDLTEINAAA